MTERGTAARTLALVGGAFLFAAAFGRLQAGLPFKTLDGRLFYSFPDAVRLFAAMTPRDRLAYARIELLDLAFIAYYVWALSRLLPRERLRVPALAAAPLLTGVADLLETGVILLVLAGALPPAALVVPAFATPVKWACAAFCLAGLLSRRGAARP